eukprot:scaffold350_cov117-Isochrysis_galbana.AAC.2
MRMRSDRCCRLHCDGGSSSARAQSGQTEPPTLQAMAGATGGAAAFVAPPRRAAARAANGDAAVGAMPAGGLIADTHAGGGALRAKSSCAGAVCSAGELLGRWARTGMRGREPGARAGSHGATPRLLPVAAKSAPEVWTPAAVRTAAAMPTATMADRWPESTAAHASQ